MSQKHPEPLVRVDQAACLEGRAAASKTRILQRVTHSLTQRGLGEGVQHARFLTAQCSFPPSSQSQEEGLAQTDLQPHPLEIMSGILGLKSLYSLDSWHLKSDHLP